MPGTRDFGGTFGGRRVVLAVFWRILGQFFWDYTVTILIFLAGIVRT
jgi:hypothetical protein